MNSLIIIYDVIIIIYDVVIIIYDVVIEQVDDLGMGFCLSPLMTVFAFNVIEQAFPAPRPLIRCEDNCHVLFENKNEAEQFILNLNSHHSSLEFIIE